LKIVKSKVAPSWAAEAVLMMRAAPEANRRQDEISHVVERERAFKPVLSQPARGEKCASVIDQDIDGRFLVCDLRSNTFHLGQACEIGKVCGVVESVRASGKPC
jgi:anti-sigma factor RsiW